jgi:hypothetical protein
MACPSLPEGARRLFSAEDLETIETAPAAPAGATGPELSRVIARLLEDGDSADLAWLSAAVGEPALAAWLERHGERALSRRSLAFWGVALGRPRRGGARATDAQPPGASLPPEHSRPTGGLSRPGELPAALPRRALWPL